MKHIFSLIIQHDQLLLFQRAHLSHGNKFAQSRQ